MCRTNSARWSAGTSSHAGTSGSRGDSSRVGRHQAERLLPCEPRGAQHVPAGVVAAAVLREVASLACSGPCTALKRKVQEERLRGPLVACIAHEADRLVGPVVGRVVVGRIGRSVPARCCARSRAWFLTFVENILLGTKLSEFHTGYRAFSRELLESTAIRKNSDDFVFDNQMLAQIIWCGATIAEVSCPTRYFPEASSINFRRSVRYGIGCLWTGISFRLAKGGVMRVSWLPRSVQGRLSVER